MSEPRLRWEAEKWQAVNGSASFRLAPGEVHIWKAGLTPPASALERCRQLLSSEELARAARFYFEKDRDHFIVAHAMLRDVLSRYLGVGPRDIQFSIGSHGKPALAEPSPLCDFNLSHSGELALLAVTRGQTVGLTLSAIAKALADRKSPSVFSPWKSRASCLRCPRSGAWKDFSSAGPARRPTSKPRARVCQFR